LGSKTILNALSENGYADLAYKVASQETYPSWGWWIANGATSLLENWRVEDTRNLSMNHIMFGEISAWLFKGLGGIFPDEEQPGFKNIILKPNFVTGLAQFEAKHNGPYGTIISSWKKSEGKVVYNVIIPANSTATLYLKDNQILENGNKLSESKNLQIEKNGNDLLKINLKPGNYVFSITEYLN
jgi:alpha-L-rhamnosidase